MTNDPILDEDVGMGLPHVRRGVRLECGQRSWSYQLEGALSIGPDGNAGAYLTEGRRCFVDPDIDVTMLEQADGKSQATDAATNDRNAECCWPGADIFRIIWCAPHRKGRPREIGEIQLPEKFCLVELEGKRTGDWFLGQDSNSAALPLFYKDELALLRLHGQRSDECLLVTSCHFMLDHIL